MPFDPTVSWSLGCLPLYHRVLLYTDKWQIYIDLFEVLDAAFIMQMMMVWVVTPFLFSTQSVLAELELVLVSSLVIPGRGLHDIFLDTKRDSLYQTQKQANPLNKAFQCSGTHFVYMIVIIISKNIDKNFNACNLIILHNSQVFVRL